MWNHYTGRYTKRRTGDFTDGKVGKEDGAEERVLDHLLLKELLTSLDKEERKLIYLRYFAEKDTDSGRKGNGNFPGSGSRMEKKILKNLRERI